MLPRLLLLASLAAPCAAQTTTTFAEALQQARLPIVLKDGNLAGTGGDFLSQQIKASRFVLIGESHFSKQIPEFTAAVCNSMHPDVYVSEAAPSAGNLTTELLGKPDRIERLQARLRQFPESMAFLNIREENDLANTCAHTSHNPHFQVWGVDQEYLGSAGYLLNSMALSKPGPKTQAAIHSAQLKEKAAENEAQTTGDYLKLYLITLSDPDLQNLTDAITADGTAETKRLLHEYTESRGIYRMFLDRNAETNHRRSLLMKQHFIADYSAFHQTHPDGRLLFKFGAMHVGKGFNALHQIDLGDMVAQLADAEGVSSLHIMIFGAHGTQGIVQGYRKPMKIEPFDMATESQESWAAPALAAMFPAGADNTLTLIDLRKLRYRKLDMPAEWQRTIDSYDLFVIIPQVSPATTIE